MTLVSHATAAVSDAPDAVLDVLSGAAKGRAMSAARRVVATPDSYNPDEGLALLDAYVSIADAAVRQAVLDIVITIAATDPYRRTRSSTTKDERRVPRRPFDQEC